jgi:two-component system sensor histidine kinase DesK
MGIAATGGLDDRRVVRARALTLAWLAGAVVTSVLMPGVGLIREPRPTWIVLGSIGTLCFAVTQAGVLYGAVAPGGVRGRPGWTVAFVIATGLSIALVAPVAAGTWQSWAWIGAAVVGTLPVLLRPRWVVVAAAAVCVIGAAVASLTGGRAGQALVIVAVIGATSAVVNLSVLWLWRVIADAQAGHVAIAALAVSEERLRFAREVHDILGHTLTVIALKAELLERRSSAARPAPPNAAGGTDGVRDSSEAAEIRRLAASALEEMRSAVAGSRYVELADEIDALRRVLEASGVRCTVRVEGDPAGRRLATLAPIAREAVTNVLRHSRASWCEIALMTVDRRTVLVVRNDGAAHGATHRDPASGGLAGVRERLREAGGVLTIVRDDDTFELRAELGGPA